MTLDELLDAHLGTRYSAAVVRIERGGRVVYERAVGTLRDDGGGAVYVDTRFDLASITKVFVATVALALVARGVLALDEPLVGASTLRMILAHTGGFRSGADYRTLFDEHIETFAVREPLIAPPGERVVYSDLGFLALGAALAERAQLALEPLVRARTARPRQPVCRVTFARAACTRRMRASRRPSATRGAGSSAAGRVHDEKAALAGGVAGHAGLFADAQDVARMGEWYLGPRFGRPSPLPAAAGGSPRTSPRPRPIRYCAVAWAGR